MKKFFAVFSLILSIILLAALTWLPSQYVVPVVMYHNVDQSFEEPLNNVRPVNFDHQMAFLKKYGYQVITSDQLVDGIKSGRNFGMHAVVITFDDGNASVYTKAYPVLKKYGFPATFYVPPGNIDKPGRMTWDQLREAAAAGMTIGSHTMSEAYLPEMHGAQLTREIVDSKKALEEKVGQPVGFLSYPVGGFTEEVKALARQAGYKAAFATNRGYDRQNRDLFELKRIRIKDTDSDFVLWVKLSGFYNLIRKSKEPY